MSIACRCVSGFGLFGLCVSFALAFQPGPCNLESDGSAFTRGYDGWGPMEHDAPRQTLLRHVASNGRVALFFTIGGCRYLLPGSCIPLRSLTPNGAQCVHFGSEGASAQPLRMPQLTPAELSLVDDLVRGQRKSPTEAWRVVNAGRCRHGAQPVEKSTVHRYCRGETHRRDAKETRGRKPILSKRDISKLQQARRRLIRVANGNCRVTYQDIIDEAALDKDVGKQTVEAALRAEGVGYRKPREKIQLSEKDAKERLKVAKEWLKKPRGFWSGGVHAYLDNKAFPMPLTQAQREKYKQTKISGHLRTKSEGIERGFTKPRQRHAWIGFPSINVSCALAKDRVIMWVPLASSWNGAAAEALYKGPLLTAMRRTWGAKRKYLVVEDGDRKGFQSNKGKAAKAEVGIAPLVLPPRTPSLMPLDYKIWDEIDKLVLQTAPAGNETKEAFLLRLQQCAKTLPRGMVKSAIARFKDNLQAIVDARGYHPKND